jgi:septum formation protein
VYITKKKIILASQSPRRKAFLEELGLSFRTIASSLDETREEGESPQTFVDRMACEKAKDVSKRYPDAWILSADTIVYIEDKVFGKPESEEEAIEMLMTLSGREHNVMTGYCLASYGLNINIVERVRTRVRFVEFSKEIARAYVQTGEPLDKAGSYGIQGKGGALVEGINGSYSNVVGLPLAETLALLQKFDVISVS